MATRSRSISLDATKNQIFANVQSTATATGAQTIASGAPSTKSVGLSTASFVVDAKQLTGGGILLSSSGAVLTKVLASFAVVGKVTNATLQKLNINIYKGTQYAGASLVLSKSVLVNTLSAQSLLASTDPAISLDAGQLLYIDIAYAVQPTTRPKGLLVSFTYVPL